MAQINKQYTFVDENDANPAEVNTNFDDIYNEFNGNIDHNNLDLTITAFQTALLNALKNVDGDGSGLDADLFNGREMFVQSAEPTGDNGDIWIKT